MALTAPRQDKPARQARAMLEYQQRRTFGGIRYLKLQDQQCPIFDCEKQGRLVLGGNRSGKTVAGGAFAAGLLTKDPLTWRGRPIPKRPVYVWCVSEDLPGQEGHRQLAADELRVETHKQLEELKRWIPRDLLRGDSWAKAYSPSEYTLRLKDGSTALFKSYKQSLVAFESDAVDGVWFDEEPPKQNIFTSCLARLVDRRGVWIMTATPLLSLAGQCWIEDALYDKWTPESNYDIYTLSTLDNPHLEAAGVEALRANLSEEEEAVRIRGSFARVGGLVFPEYDPRTHDFEPCRADPSLRHEVYIDVGMTNPTCILLVELSKDGEIFVLDEIYQAEVLPAEHLINLRMLLLSHGLDPKAVDQYMDPSAWNRDPAGREPVALEWQHQADLMRMGWFGPQPANNDEVSGVWRTKAWLRARDAQGRPMRPRIHISKSCKWLKWELGRLNWKRVAQGIAGDQQHRPEKPRDKDNHATDCLRYCVNNRPEPVPVAALEKTPLQQHWDRLARAALDERAAAYD